jgi:hypothetical protein
MEANGFTDGRNILTRHLKDLNLPTHEKKINRKCVSVRLGIRRKVDGEE